MSARGTTAALVTMATLAMPARAAAAEWQIKPFLGVTFGGDTTFVLNDEVSRKRLSVGVNAALIGEIVGIEFDVGHTPGFFGTNSGFQSLVLKSSVTTMTGNVIIAVPRHMARYSLRPYVVVGGGRMNVDLEDLVSVFTGDNLAAIDVGGGATGFVTNHVGVSWDVRYFRSVGDTVAGSSVGPEKLSFWRATMAAAIRFK